MESARSPKPTSSSRLTLARIMDDLDANLHGNVHGGVIMKAVDDAAGACAARHCRAPAVTAAMDEMVFVEPVRVGDILHHPGPGQLGRSDVHGGRGSSDGATLGRRRER